jgi:uncharacterized protein (TIGR02302 family)
LIEAPREVDTDFSFAEFSIAEFPFERHLMRESDAPRNPFGTAGLLSDRLKRRIVTTRIVIALERSLPPLILIATLLALFAAIAGFGLLASVPPLLRQGLVALLALICCGFLFRIIAASQTTLMEALKRLDHDQGQLPLSITPLFDQPASPHPSRDTAALWQAHRDRMIAAFEDGAVKLAPLAMAERDPFGLRIAAWLLVAASIFVSAPDWTLNLQSALSSEHNSKDALFARIEAWIDFPDFAAGMPIVLSDAQMQKDAPPLTVPAGSLLTIRSSDHALPILSTSGQLTEKQSAAQSRQWVLEGEATVRFRDARSVDKTIKIVATPVAAPHVAFSSMDQLPSGAVLLRYKVSDDHGIAKGTVRLSNPRLPEHEPLPTQDALVAPLSMSITLPSDKRHGELSVRLDPTNAPWSGMTADVALDVENSAGLHTVSEPVPVLIPRPPYRDRLARALLELRQIVSFDPSQRETVISRLSALQIAPDYGPVTVGTYLALRGITGNLVKAHSRPAMLAVSEDLFALAQALEDEHTQKVQESLESAQNALRKALDEALTDDQRADLMARIKKALEAYDQQSSNDDNADALSDPTGDEEANAALMDRLAKMIQSGSKEAMQEALATLDQLIKQLGTQIKDGAPNTDLLNRSFSVLREERALKDETSQTVQGKKNDPPSKLADRQSEILDHLKALQDLAKAAEAGNADSFDDAGVAMDAARQSLRDDDMSKAMTAESTAVDALKRAITAMVANQKGDQSSSQKSGRASGKTQKSLNGKSGPQSHDPFARSGRQPDMDSGDEGLNSDAQSPEAKRSRDITSELWRRLDDRLRPAEEHDYFLRLLDKAPTARP